MKWTSSQLSAPRYSAAISLGNVVFFAGEYFTDLPDQHRTSDVIDIYDPNTTFWSSALLSYPSTYLASVAIRNLAMFAGGCYYTNNCIPLNTIDIPHEFRQLDHKHRWSLAATSVDHTQYLGEDKPLSIPPHLAMLWIFTTKHCWWTGFLSVPRANIYS